MKKIGSNHLRVLVDGLWPELVIVSRSILFIAECSRLTCIDAALLKQLALITVRFTVFPSRKTNFPFLFPFGANKWKFAFPFSVCSKMSHFPLVPFFVCVYIHLYCYFKWKTEAQVIFLNLFTITLIMRT
jgi:hypothetical protein